MADETLHTAARRVVRDFNIVMNHGGLIGRDFEHSMHTLDQMVQVETARQKRAEEVAKLPQMREAAVQRLQALLHCDEAEARRVFDEHTVTA